MSSHQNPAPHSQKQGELAPEKASIDAVEHLPSSYSKDFAAVAEGRGFKPDDGRLVVDPKEAVLEYGEEVCCHRLLRGTCTDFCCQIASRLKTNKKGTKILWPQRE